jgi:hypothetical protein
MVARDFIARRMLPGEPTPDDQGNEKGGPEGPPLPWSVDLDQSAQSAYAVIVQLTPVLLNSTASTVQTVADDA